MATTTKRRWARPAIVLCAFVVVYFSTSSPGDPLASSGGDDGRATTSLSATVPPSTSKQPPPPFRGKVPTCMTSGPECVLPHHPIQTVPCLVRQRQKIDPNGAWLLPQNFMYKFDVAFADAALEKVLGGSRVLELGAGLGCYTLYWRESGKVSSIDAYEGAANVESMSGGFVRMADLTKPQDFVGGGGGSGESGGYDWVVCMEVAEHIPPEFEAVFLMNLVTPARRGVLLSWGLPGQNGIGHVNLQSNNYVVELMKSLGFEYDKERSDYIRSKSRFDWFKGTTMVFTNSNYFGVD
ncbi:hypothetical protein ACHAWF_000967 [Thalassiosira exigua]